MRTVPGADKCQQEDLKRRRSLPGLIISLIPTEAHKEPAGDRHRALLTKTNKEALAVPSQLAFRSILARSFGSSSGRSRDAAEEG